MLRLVNQGGMNFFNKVGSVGIGGHRLAYFNICGGVFHIGYRIICYRICKRGSRKNKMSKETPKKEKRKI